MKDLKKTYDFICFSELAYELDFSNPKAIEKKIKRRLKYYNFGAYNQKHIDYIRELKDYLYQEISLKSKSKYYKKTASDYLELNDFDMKRLKLDTLKKYQEIDSADMDRILNFSVYLYYIR